MSAAKIGLVYAAHTTVDEYGRLGKCLGYYKDEPSAKVAAHKQGWYGSDGAVAKVHVIEVDGNVYALASPDPITVAGTKDIEELVAHRRSLALAKLTKDERELLGLKEEP